MSETVAPGLYWIRRSGSVEWEPARAGLLSPTGRQPWLLLGRGIIYGAADIAEVGPEITPPATSREPPDAG